MRKKGKLRVVEKEFGDDFVSATRLYDKARRAKKPFATLVCKNVGFGPPVDLRPLTVMRTVGRRNGKKVKAPVLKEPLLRLNDDGVFWCPYCRELRRFMRFTEFRGSAHEVMKCPICGVSHRDHYVRVWNPLARKLPDHIERRRTRGRTNTRRTRR